MNPQQLQTTFQAVQPSAIQSTSVDILQTSNIAQEADQLELSISKDEPAVEANAACKAHWKALKFSTKVKKMKGEQNLSSTEF